MSHQALRGDEQPAHGRGAEELRVAAADADGQGWGPAAGNCLAFPPTTLLSRTWASGSKK